jgi:hypothetical protein
MAASRAGKLIFGAFAVWSLMLIASISIAADQEAGANGTELIPTPTPTEGNENLASVGEDSNIATDESGDCGCTFEGVPLCSPPGRIWFRGDWLMWWTSGMDLPPLVTTSPQGTAQSQAGVLGQPGTSVLFGDSTVYNGGRSGVRMTIGGWLDNCHRWGLEADWLTLGGQSINYNQSSLGNPILARPFFNVETNAQDSQLKAYPDVVTGTVSVVGNTYFDSAGVDFRYNLCCNSCCDPCQESCGDECGSCGSCGGCNPCSQNYCRTDLLFGYRYYTLGDNLAIGEDIFDTRTESRFQITDIFNTRNEFHGAEIGLNTELRRGRWSLGLLAKMALGNNHQTARINGTTTITSGTQVATYEGGIYAVGSNSGLHERDELVVIPQLGAEMGYQVTCRLRAFVGYNLLYWATVMRAGDQIDLNLDPRQFPPVVAGALPYPAFPNRQTNFWAQGINIGAELRF